MLARHLPIVRALLLLPALLFAAPRALAQEIAGDWTLTGRMHPPAADSVRLTLTHGSERIVVGAAVPVPRLQGVSPARLSVG